jgi:hypothetical protein
VDTKEARDRAYNLKDSYSKAEKEESMQGMNHDGTPTTPPSVAPSANGGDTSDQPGSEATQNPTSNQPATSAPGGAS